VSKSSCLSGGTAALRYANNAEIDMSSVDSYVDAKRYSTEENMKCFLDINLSLINRLEHVGRRKLTSQLENRDLPMQPARVAESEREQNLRF
jgi:hypothetical protein